MSPYQSPDVIFFFGIINDRNGRTRLVFDGTLCNAISSLPETTPGTKAKVNVTIPAMKALTAENTTPFFTDETVNCPEARARS